MTQPDTIKVNIKNQKFELTDLNRFYDCGNEFNIELSGDQLKKVFENNPNIAFDHLKWGDDTVVGDNFFKALVQEFCGKSLSEVKNLYGDNSYYDYVTNQAILKGYKLLD